MSKKNNPVTLDPFQAWCHRWGRIGTLLAGYVPALLLSDTIQALVMITGLIVAIVLGAVAKKPGLAWLNNFIMAGSMIAGMVSSLLWTSIF